MTAQLGKPRNIIGLVLIAMFLGATPLMLWMGRGKAAFIYLLIGIALVVAFFGAAMSGLLPMQPFAVIDPATVIYAPLIPLAVAAFIHALAIRRTALGRPWYSDWFIALPSVSVAGLVLAFLVRTFLFHPYNAPSASMEPSLMVGDFFFVSKIAYLIREPERGEIAVFRLPSDPGVVYVKRVIGLPGERLQMKDGVVHINGTPVASERVELAPIFTQNGTASLSRETLPEGRSYVVADTKAEGPADTTEEFLVPANSYFVMGDNRDNSQDSRFPQTGFIPRENFIGPFAFRIWNAEGIPLNDRP